MTRRNHNNYRATLVKLPPEAFFVLIILQEELFHSLSFLLSLVYTHVHHLLLQIKAKILLITTPNRYTSRLFFKIHSITTSPNLSCKRKDIPTWSTFLYNQTYLPKLPPPNALSLSLSLPLSPTDTHQPPQRT